MENEQTISTDRMDFNGARLNKKDFFNCSKCGLGAYAHFGTKRSKQKLCKNCFGKKKDNRANQLNNLTGAEWALLSKSVMEYNGVRTQNQRIHGAAFPLSLVIDHIKIYTKKGDIVLDPFVGVGTTSQASQMMGRRSIGIELNPEFIELAEKDIIDKTNHKLICDDVRNIRKYLLKNSIDFQITSPPYSSLLKSVKTHFGHKWREHSELKMVSNPRPYSTLDGDLGNLPYSKFLEEIEKIFVDIYYVLKNESYAVWVVKDFRDIKNGIPYVNFHSDIIVAAQKAGFVLWDIRVYDQTKFRTLVVLGYPSRNYYLNMGHSYILIFKKNGGE